MVAAGLTWFSRNEQETLVVFVLYGKRKITYRIQEKKSRAREIGRKKSCQEILHINYVYRPRNKKKVCNNGGKKYGSKLERPWL